MRKHNLPTQPLRHPREIAEALGVGYSSVNEWLRDGRIASVRVGKLYRISQDEFDRVLVEGVRPKEEAAESAPQPVPELEAAHD